MAKTTAVHNSTPHVLVVGGGPAGAICARGLAQKGLEVTLCEAYPHPSETLRRGNKAYCIVVNPRGQRALEQVGIDCKNIEGAKTCGTLARHSSRGIKTIDTSKHAGVVVSRKSLAKHLLHHAQQAGVQLPHV